MTMGQFKVLLPGVPAVTSRGYLGYCSVVLFDLGGEPALFDVGHHADRARLVEALREAGLTPGEIRHVVLSHLHFDHALNLPLFPQATVYLSRAERGYAAQVSAGRRVDHSLPDFCPRLLQEIGRAHV
jgi:glyoxylase-like metal-dependent hydrolase (beta-lactamase superfamily II)